MKKALKFISILTFLLSCHFSQSQTSEKNLQKYWKYRERLKNFVVVGDCEGCGLINNK
jgi:hypothetical protein